MRFGFTKKRVLPVPEPPMTTTFLLREYFGSRTNSSMLTPSVCERMMFWSGSGFMNGLMSAFFPQRELPYSSPGRRYDARREE